MAEETNIFINYVMSMLLKKIIVPSDYHGQVRAVKELQKDDLTGLVDSLTDFAVDCASVDFRIETDNDKFTEILKKWSEKVNIGYKGRIPPGIRELAREYFKERWKYSSFPILKISKWEASKEFGGVILPIKMFFVDGESIHAKDRDEKDENLTLLSYDYYLGKKSDKPLQNNTIFSRPYGRWFDKYPTPYLVKRGVYHNWRIIKSLKEMQTKILDQVIPYIFLIKKGTAQLVNQQVKTYSNPELQQIIKDFQNLMDEMKSVNIGDKSIKSPIRATNFDEELKHLIPDLGTIFDIKLFAQAERNILAGLGFIDIVEAVTTSRRESILNPKGFIEEVRAGVEDFKNHVLKPLIFMIQEKNEKHKKYMNAEFYICSSPVKAFISDDFKEKIRQLYDRGRISSQTAVELIAETDFQTEVYRREKEAKQGISETMYPPVRENREGEGVDLPSDFEIPKDTDEEEIPDDKKDKIEKENYDIGMTLEEAFKPEITENYIRLRQRDPADFQKKSFRIITLSAPKGIKAVIGRLKGKTTTTTQSYLFDKKKWTTKSAQAWVREHSEEAELVTAPYNKIADLPASVRKALSPGLQGTFLRVFNKAYQQYHNDTRAFRVAWAVIKKIAKKNKKGKWVRKSSRLKISKEMLIEAIQEAGGDELDKAIKTKKLEVAQKQKELLDKLLKK